MQPNIEPKRAHPPRARLAVVALLLAASLAPAKVVWAGQTESPKVEPALPEAPRPQAAKAGAEQPAPCRLRKPGAAPAVAPITAPPASGAVNPSTEATPQAGVEPVPCPPLAPFIDWYARFTNGPQVKPMKPREKAWLAVRNIADPFNAVTILGSSAIAVGSNSHSPYGPGMTGFGRYVGVSYTQDITGEFVGTFLIPSIVHQDPHYHRMPGATIKRRIAHCIYQVVWTQGDNGKGMVNFADVVGFGIDDEVANLYVPGRETNLRASGERYATNLALAPTDNFVTEFLPDVARKIHVHAVLIQWIIDQVARSEGQ
ncbi:MAG: hypothetical protein ABR898_03695 [Terracidiphilus sp.]